MGSSEGSAPVFVVNGVSIPVVQELSSKLSPPLSDSDNGNSSSTSAQDLQIQLLKRYIRSDSERPNISVNPLNPTLEQQNLIPVIDMSIISESPQQMEKLKAACQEWGFFQIVKHGIQLDLLERVKAVARGFFDLPLQEKLKYAGDSGNGYGQAFVFSEQQPLEWADSFSIHAMPEHQRNLKLWPESPSDFRESMEQYINEIQQLIERLMKLLAQNLGLTPEVKFCNNHTLAVRLNYYPPCPRPDLALGLSPHTDGSIITVLLQEDDTVGLHIRRNKDEEWLPVPPIPSALVINIGDSLEVLSNGRYKSVEHRAVTNMNASRLSIAAFYNPCRHEIIGPIHELIDEQHPAAYRTFSRNDFAKHYFGSRLQGKQHTADFIKIAPGNT